MRCILQDLRCALQKTRAELQAKETALKESEVEKHTVVQEKEGKNAQLKQCLREKELQLQVINQQSVLKVCRDKI